MLIMTIKNTEFLLKCVYFHFTVVNEVTVICYIVTSYTLTELLKGFPVQICKESICGYNVTNSVPPAERNVLFGLMGKKFIDGLTYHNTGS